MAFKPRWYPYTAINEFETGHRYEDREDGLSHCLVCGGAEGSLPTLCPGRKMTAAQHDGVYARELDFNLSEVWNAEPARWWSIPWPAKDH